MTDIKKASDVILEIDSKIDQLLSFFKNHDNNQKLIISRLDKIYKSLNQEKNSFLTDHEYGISKSVKDIEAAITAEGELTNKISENDFVDVPSVSEVSSLKRILVHQTVKYPKVNNKQLPVILAKVKIYQEPGLKVNPKMDAIVTCTTNANGIWEAELNPGTYYVHIVKPGTTTKPQIDFYNEIVVPSDQKVLELSKLD